MVLFGKNQRDIVVFGALALVHGDCERVFEGRKPVLVNQFKRSVATFDEKRITLALAAKKHSDVAVGEIQRSVVAHDHHGLAVFLVLLFESLREPVVQRFDTARPFADYGKHTGTVD